MALQEFLEEVAKREAYRQNMRKLGQTRDRFLEMLAEDGVENTRGRKMTTVKLAAAGDWAEKNDIQVEIFVAVSKNKLRQLQQANKKPTVQAKLTFNDKVVRYSIPNDVTRSEAHTGDYLFYSDKIIVGNESYCVGLAGVMEYFQAGKLTIVRE